MKVIIACEFSGIVRDAFIARGHDAISCDLLPSERPGPHIVRDIRTVDLSQFDMMIAHPPCTYLTNAGVRHLYDHVVSSNGRHARIHGAERWAAMAHDAEFFNYLQHAPVPLVAVENPIPHRYARERIGKYTQIIHPWQFGHGESKATCLWLRGLPLLRPTNIVEGRYPRAHLESPSPERWKNRSRTYQGIAIAMAEQWGS